MLAVAPLRHTIHVRLHRVRHDDIPGDSDAVWDVGAWGK
jgi:hypothetical protein